MLQQRQNHHSKTKTVFFLGAILLFLASTAIPSSAQAPIVIGSRLELLVDDQLIDKMDHAQFKLHQPVPREIALVYDEDWEGNTSGYPTVIRDGDLYRMYYIGSKMVLDPKGLRKAQGEVACYAESKDGIHWTKPNLGLFDWKGSKENNIIWLGGPGHDNLAPFLDSNPNCHPDARFKAAGGNRLTGLVAFQSSDGIRWTKMQEEPIITKGAFDSLNTVFWDSVRKKYALYLRVIKQVDSKGYRAVAVAYSDDFLNWTEWVPLIYPNSPPQQMYTNNIIPYYRAPHLLMGFPTRYVDRKISKHIQKLDPAPLRDQLIATYERAGTDLTDGLFMTSRDGINFKRWDEAFLRPGLQQLGNWTYGDNYQSYGLVETSPTDPGGPNEISFYSSEGYWREGEIRSRRYSIRLDGFVSVNAPFSGGEVTTKLLAFEGQSLLINYSTSAAGYVRVELQNDRGEPIDGFRLEDCPEHFGDSVSQVIQWDQGSDVSSLARTPIRIRFVLKDADIFSFYFAASEIKH